MIISHRLYTSHVTDEGRVLTRIWHRDGRVQVFHWVPWSDNADGTQTGVYMLAEGS